MRLSNIKLLIFDCDGVIIDSAGDIADAVRVTLHHFGSSPIDNNQVIGNLGLGPDNLIKQCFQVASKELLLEAIPFYKAYYYENCTHKTILYPHIESVLRNFSHIKMAMVTNKPEGPTKRILEHLGVLSCFDLVIGPESVTHPKPHPEGALKVLDCFGIPKDNTLFVGDSEYDVMAAKDAGVLSCAVTYGYGNQTKIKALKPDFIIDDFSVLQDLLR